MSYTKVAVPGAKGCEDLLEENRRLKNDLFAVRQALVDLLDPQDLLDGYFRVEDFHELDRWREKCAVSIIEAAWVRPGADMGDPRWPRAICPLCRRGALGARDVQGFAVPEGLRRHLLGELNSRQCHVFAAAEDIAREIIQSIQDGHWHPRVRG